METPYGGLWYAAGNPDGFRFGSVNRPSPSRAMYTFKLQTSNFQLQECDASKLMGQIVKETFYPVYLVILIVSSLLVGDPYPVV